MIGDDIANLIATPGDEHLDCCLIGLRIESLVLNWHGRDRVEGILTFATGDAIGWWADSVTGERVIPDSVTSTEACFGVTMAPGFGFIARKMMARLEAWQADGALVSMTAAPGKWTLLRASGQQVVLPRGMDGAWLGEDGGQ